MHHLIPNDLSAALADLSTARLSSYVNFFGPTDDRELYGLYCWNDAVSSRVMRLIGVIEIILRNRFHVALSQHYWRPAKSRGVQDSNDWYLKLYRPYAPRAQQNEGDKKLRNKLGPKTAQASPSKVIAGMTYGFWPRVLDAQYDVNGLAVPWGILLPQIVPGHHQRDVTYWNVTAHQDALFARMDLVGEVRNRVAHFEPLWKFGPEKAETRERSGVPRSIISPMPTTVAEALTRLEVVYKRSTQLLYWLSKTRAAEYSNSEAHQALRWLMTNQALDHFRDLPKHREVRLSSFARRWDLKAELRQSGFVLIRDKNERVGRYYAEPC